MELESLRVRNFGPFAEEAVLNIEPDVTVLTGGNDSGKSSILRLLKLFSEKSPITESDVNNDRHRSSNVPWEQDKSIKARFTFKLTEHSDLYFSQAERGGFADVSWTMPPQVNRFAADILDTDRTKRLANQSVNKLPRVIWLPDDDEIGDTVDLVQATGLERQLLQVAFGPRYNPQQLLQLNPPNFTRELNAAREQLNAAVQSLLPASMQLQFQFLPTDVSRRQISIDLTDMYDGHVPLSARGAGVRRIISLIGTLLQAKLDEEHVMILFDEPETSLHADAQHSLRRVLEALAAKPTVQVIYATHSPSMVNNMRPGSIRLLERAHKDGIATSAITNDPVRGNFYSVRSSLGLSPSDSLLYAPVCVVVEGDTEVLGLPILLKRLQDESVEGFESADALLSQCHFLDGAGDSYEYLCRLAKSQSSQPVLFLDGDKMNTPRLNKTISKHPELPIVTLAQGMEFEEIVPQETYFAALSAHLGTTTGISADAFASWEASADLPERMAFSKRVDRWLTEHFDTVDPKKAAVMKIALENVDIEKIDPKPFRELLTVIGRRVVSPDL